MLVDVGIFSKRSRRKKKENLNSLDRDDFFACIVVIIYSSVYLIEYM